MQSVWIVCDKWDSDKIEHISIFDSEDRALNDYKRRKRHMSINFTLPSIEKLLMYIPYLSDGFLHFSFQVPKGGKD
ncbi:hypothetical protein AZF37_01420 [endosymbiont 'TC1' of Trimyema compressum]|nr:hypothetical protein AZF37_01420 [endosymbiont 'TC1' of Trimyema compressum]